MLTLQYAPVNCYGTATAEQQVDPDQENIPVESTAESTDNQSGGYLDQYSTLAAMQNADIVTDRLTGKSRVSSRNSENNNGSPYDYYGQTNTSYGHQLQHLHQQQTIHQPEDTGQYNAEQNQYPLDAVNEYSAGLHLTAPDSLTTLTPISSPLPPSLSAAAILPAHHHSHAHYYQMNATISPGTIQQRTFPVIYDSAHLVNKTNNPYGTRSTTAPFLNIIEQPTNRIRYRYRSEKGSHGGLNGENSCHMKKTYPTVKLENYSQQSAQVYIRVSLATNEENPKLHVHKLMGRHCSEDGACTLPVNENMIGVFQNLGILFIGKKEVPEILFRRKLTDIQIRFGSQTSTPQQQQPPPINDKMQHKLRQESERESKDMNLNSVRICFEAFQLQNDALYSICPPVYSRPIANQKSPDSGELKIIRINRYCGSVKGGDEVYILCEKVNKKEIRVRFFEIDQDGNQQWESFGSFSESDVHHQVAIVFRTPPYRNQNLLKPVRVYLQLFRQRDGEFSEPRTFIYKPKVIGGCGGGGVDNGFGNGNEDFDILSSKSGLQESVLSQIKLENQPPGYKRRKFNNIHNQSAKAKPCIASAASQRLSANSTVENSSSATTTSSSTGSRNQHQPTNGSRNSRTSSSISTRKSNSDKLSATIKTEPLSTANSKVRSICAKLSPSTTTTETSNNNAQDSSIVNNNSANTVSQRSNNANRQQIEVDFCQGTDVKFSANNTNGSSSSSSSKRPRETALLSSVSSLSCSLLSPPSSSPSCSSSSSSASQSSSLSSTTSPTSPQMTDASVPLQSFNQLIHNNHHQFQHQHQPGPIDFDHLDSMWQSAPPPPLPPSMSADSSNHSNLFQNFLSIQSLTSPNSSNPTYCTSPQMQQPHHAQQQQNSQNHQSFVEVILNHHHDHQTGHGTSPNHHLLHPHPIHHSLSHHHHNPSLSMLDPHLSIISLDVPPPLGHHGSSSASLISHSPSMSSSSPSSVSSSSANEHHHLSSASSSSSSPQSSNFQFNPNIGTLQCMLYS